MASRSAFGRDRNNTMPGTSRFQQKAEARYNVTTQFPQYDLHFAAASGNLGLVEFALSHGQPINSVLNGVLPLHAACAGGSEVVVKYLIDEGADVNAPRIPRRYSNEKHKSSGLALGASGSTPLHFAAANGHLGVVKLLLAHGAVPDRADKHGVTPEMLARNTGWVECADVLSAWSGGRAGDLPPVQPGGNNEASAGSGSGSGIVASSGSNCPFGNRGNGGGATAGNGIEALGTFANSGNNGEREKEKDGSEILELVQSGSRRLHMKRSIDNALHLFKTPLLQHHGSHGQLRDKSPPSPSAAAHPQSHSQSQLHSIFPLHHHHHHSHSHGESPSSHSHLHSIFHHAHSHSTSQLQTQAQSGSQSQSTSSSTSVADQALRPSLSTGASVTSSSSLTPNSSSSPFDTLGVPPGNRRPSLPHIFNEPASPFQRRLSGRKRRPRSAGSDAGQGQEAVGGGAAGNGNPANANVNPSGNVSGVSGVRLGAIGMLPNLSSTGANVNVNANANVVGSGTGSGTITARKLSSKISLRNLFRRAGGEPSVTVSSANSNANLSATLSGSEPGSGTASASTSFSTTAPIYNHSFSSSAGARGTTSPTPPASPLSASFAPSPSPIGAGGGGGGRPSSWYRQRIGSEGAGSVPVPRSPLVPSAVDLHHRYSQDQLHEEFEREAASGVGFITTGADGVSGSAPGPGVVAPRLSARRSILRGQRQNSGGNSSNSRLNRSNSSQSSSGTGTPGGTRTLRFDASSTASPASTFGGPSMSPEPRWGPSAGAGNASAVRLRGTRSASSLRHEHSFGYDEDEEEEEEDYGTSIINPSESTALRYDDAELEESTAILGGEGGRDVAASEGTANYVQYASTGGRARGASFASTVSSLSPGASPEDRDATYEMTEFPFSIDGPPPLTPVSVTSEASVTTRYGLPDDAPSLGDVSNGNDKSLPGGTTTKRSTESRARGESFSSIDTDRSEPSQTGTSSTSNLTTPSPGPGGDLRMASVLSGDENDTEVPPQRLRSDPLDLDLRGISNLAEAEALVRRAQQAILASASLPADGPESPNIPLSAQLAAYGEILALERRFARGEKQRELWAMRDDSDGEADGGGSEQHHASPNEKSEVKTPKSAKEAAKEARIAVSQKKRDDAVLRQRGATTDAVLGFSMAPATPGTATGVSSLRQRPPAKPAKHKRPHTAEGAPQASWSFSSTLASTSTSPKAADVTHSAGTSPVSHVHSHSRSTSSPLYIGKESEKMLDIAIIETTATPIDSPETTPDSTTVATRISPSPSAPAATPSAEYDYPYTRYTIDDARPSLPLRSLTPDPDPLASTDDFGVPLTRVATAPLQDSSTGYGSGSGSYNARGSSSVLRSDPATRRTGAAHKLSKMGFSVDAATHHHHASRSNHGHGHGHHYRSHRQKELQDAYNTSPASSAGSSRSPSKARFGGIKSLVRGLKGKS